MIRLGFCMAMMLALVSGANARCIPISSIKHFEKNFKPLNHDAFVAARALYAIVPPIGLPFGDRARMHVDEDGNGLIIFIDGALACAPTPVQADVVKIIEQIGKGEIHHAGEPM